MADDIGAQVRATPGLPEIIADLLGDGLGFSRLEDNDKAFEWALRAYRAGQAAVAAARRAWQLPDEPGPEVTAVRNAKGATWDRDGDVGGWRYRVSGNVPGVHGTWRRWDGLLVTEGPLTDATPTETGRAPATIDGAGRTGAGAGERVDDAQGDSGGRDG